MRPRRRTRPPSTCPDPYPAARDPANPLALPTPPGADPLNGAAFFVDGPRHGEAAAAIARMLGIDPTRYRDGLSWARFKARLAHGRLHRKLTRNRALARKVARLEMIADQPEAQRFSLYSEGGGPGAIFAQVQRIFCHNMTADPGTVPIITTLFLYQAGYCETSSEIAAHRPTFERQVDEMVAGIEHRPAVMLLELDAVGSSSCMARNGALAEWEADIRYEINRVSALPHTVVYIEGGYSDAARPAYTARVLRAVGVRNIRGFFTNDTHMNWTANEIRWGEKVSALTGGSHFIINTADNGRGPRAESASGAAGHRGSVQSARPRRRAADDRGHRLPRRRRLHVGARARNQQRQVQRRHAGRDLLAPAGADRGPQRQRPPWPALSEPAVLIAGVRSRPMTARQRYTLAVCCSLAAAGCGSSSRHAPSPKQRPVHKVQTGGAPIGLLAYAGQLWVADARTNRVLRIAPESGRVTARVAVGRTPLRIVAVDGSIWSTDFGSGTVSVVSPSELRRVATVRVGPQPEGIVRFGADVWVVSQQGRLSGPGRARKHRAPADRVPVGHQPRQVTAGAGNLWVSVFADNAVVEVDPRTRRVVARIRACQGPQGLAYAGGQLWVGCTDGSELVDIDRGVAQGRCDAFPTRQPTPSRGRETALRVTSDNGPSTGVLDPRTGELSHKVQLSDAFIGDANADVVAAGGGVWVSSPDEGTVYRVPPT